MTTSKIFTRDFVLCFLAQITFMAVYHLLVPTLPIYLSRLGSKETEIGVLVGVFGISSLVFRSIVGRALLTISEKKLMITGGLLFVLTSVAYLWASPFWPLLIVRIFQGIGFAFFYTAAMTLIANISPETYRGQSLSYFLLSVNISLALAPSFGMFLINHFDFTVLFLVCLALSLCSLFVTNQLAKREVVPSEDSSEKDGFLISWDAVPRSIVGFLFQFIWGALIAFFPLYAVRHGVANPGFFFTTLAIMMISGRALGGKILDRYSREIVILPCLITASLSMGILAFSKTLSMFIFVAVIWGIGHAFALPVLVAYTLDRAASSRGLAMGTFTAAMDLGLALGPAIMGIVIRVTSYPIMFLCLVLVGIINLNYFYFFVRGKR